MYKKHLNRTGVPDKHPVKPLLFMRFMIIVLIVSLMQVSTAAHAQKITLDQKNTPLKTVIKALHAQSGYDFIYTDKMMKMANPVSITVSDMEINDVLQAIFAGQPLTYAIREKTVVIIERKKNTVNSVPLNAAAKMDVHGKVTDETGNPLPGVNVSVKGAQRTTATNQNGEFNIRAVSPTDVLVFSFIGMQTTEVNVGNQQEITVKLQISSATLSEITINTGYQTFKKEQMTGSAVSVGSAELEQRYQSNVINNLEGRVPGLVNYNGSTTIRGVSTINASRAPLYVVDGLPIDGAVANVNPYDVKSVTVLKDAAAAAIYGARAANGVIVITTKRAKNHRTTIEVNSNVTVTDKPDINFNLLTPAQQVDLESSYYDYYYKNVSGASALTATNITNGNPITPVQYAYYQFTLGMITQKALDAQLAAFKQNDFRKQYTDNVLRKTVLQQYDLAVRTDANKFNSSLVVDYKNSNSGIIKAYNRQLNISYRGTYQMSKWLDANYGINTVIGQIQASNSGFATSATNVSPYLQLLDAEGNRAYYTTSDYNMYNTTTASMPQYSMLVNHLEELGLDARKTNQQNGRYFVNLTARIFPGLIFTPQFQYENTVTNTSAYSEQQSYIMRYLDNVYFKVPQATTPVTYANLLPLNGGKLATSESRSKSWTVRGQLNYKRQFGKNNIEVIGGTEFRHFNTKGTNGLLLGYDDQLQNQSTTSVNLPGMFAYATSTTFKPGFNTTSLFNTYFTNQIGLIPEATHRYNSGYVNATYTYNNKYAAFGSYRIDYADVFGLDKKFRGKPLWSTGLAWNVSNEDFMHAADWVDFLKLRVSYGITGNIATGVNSFLTAVSTLPANPVTNAPVSVVTSAANPQLRWEKSITPNLGVDFVFFNSRLSGSLDFYRKKSTDLLFTTRIDPSEGFTSQIINNGGLVNNGIEFMLTYSWLKPTANDGLSWTSMLSVSHNKNKITYVDAVAVLPAQLVGGGYKVGNPVNSLFSYQYKGLNDAGQPQWLKVDGSLTSVALSGSDLNAVTYSGGTDPVNVIGLTNTVYYKGFSLNILAVYYGGQYMRTQAPDVYGSGAAYGSMPAYLQNSWTPSHANTDIPGFGQYAPGTYAGTTVVPSSYLINSDTYVKPADFIKIRNVVLGYQVSQRWINRLGAQNVRLTFQLNNPKALWLKNDVGVDPETINPTTAAGGARIPTSYVLGLNFNL